MQPIACLYNRHCGRNGLASTLRWPTRIWPNLVRHFYSSEFDEERNTTLVEDILVHFSANRINEVFNIESNPNAEGNSILEQPTPSHLEDALQVVAKPKSNWKFQEKE